MLAYSLLVPPDNLTVTLLRLAERSPTDPSYDVSRSFGGKLSPVNCRRKTT